MGVSAETDVGSHCSCGITVASFSRQGVINLHSLHYLAVDNTHCPTSQFPAAVFGKCLGWHCRERPDRTIHLSDPLTAQRYLHFLQTILPGLLEDVPLAIRARMWMQHGGGPPHFGMNVREWLHRQYPRYWIGRGGPIAWPSRSPDFNSLDFNLWSHMKAIVYTSELPNRQILLQRIEEAAVCVRYTPEQL